MAINVEAKADEPFGDTTVGAYYDRTADSRSNVPARIRQLSLALFGRVPDDATRGLRYQLLHAAAATLIEAVAKQNRTGTLLGSRASMSKAEREKAHPEQRRLGELCPLISRTR